MMESKPRRSYFVGSNRLTGIDQSYSAEIDQCSLKQSFGYSSNRFR
jgi:hypothetical protein